MNENIFLLKQKQILALREELLTQENADIFGINKACFAQLKEVSPASLEPVLFQRNHEEWTAAYLVQEVGNRGKRVLIKSSGWKLVRAKKSARILKISQGKARDLFDQVTEQQIKYRVSLGNLLSLIQEEKISERKIISRKKKSLQALG